MSKLNIIDTSPFMYAAVNRKGLAEKSHGTVPTGGIEFVLRTILSELANYRDLAICFDSRSFRKDLDEAYKGDRVSDPAVRVQLDILREFLDTAKIPYFKVDEYESDDLIYNITQHFLYKTRDYSNIYIWGNDYDLIHNIDDNGIVEFVAMTSLVKSVNKYNYNTLEKGDMMFNTKTIRNVFLGDGDYKKPLKLECGLTGRQLYNAYKDLISRYDLSGVRNRDRQTLDLFLSKISSLTDNDKKQLELRKDIFYPKDIEGLDYEVFKLNDSYSLDRKTCIELVEMILSLHSADLNKTLSVFLSEFKLIGDLEITKRLKNIMAPNKYTDILNRYSESLANGTYIADNNLTFNDVTSPYSVAFDDVF